MDTRYTYAYGYFTIDAAWLAIEAMLAEGEVSQGERPNVESYKTKDGKRRYKVTLQG